ncbi:MAG: sugar phosphate isomerase [Paenibacillus sp.]|nr:sugar phosphate isomerase [Paenibacillus sp.]
MKLGLSSYSLVRALRSGEMTIEDVIQWTADQGGAHIEIVPVGFAADGDFDWIETVRAKAEQAGIAISSYTIGADFITDSREQYEAEIERVCRQVDRAYRLGTKRMRHDAAKRPMEQTGPDRFREDLPRLAEACARIADYAARFGIVTSVENHGYHLQASERVLTLLQAVNRENFKTTLDVGNFLCVDESPAAAVKRMIGHASMIHLKDFYVRPSRMDPGPGWRRSASGNYLRGAIFGHGDVDVREVLRIIKQSGYAGYVSLEFEGMEECRSGSRIGLANAKRLWEEA